MQLLPYSWEKPDPNPRNETILLYRNSKSDPAGIKNDIAETVRSIALVWGSDPIQRKVISSVNTFSGGFAIRLVPQENASAVELAGTYMTYKWASLLEFTEKILKPIGSEIQEFGNDLLSGKILDEIMAVLKTYLIVIAVILVVYLVISKGLS